MISSRWGVRRSVVASATAVLLVALIVAAAVLRVQLRGALEHSITDQAVAHAEAVSEMVAAGDLDAAVEPSRNSGWLQILDADGKVVSGSSNITQPSVPIASLQRSTDRVVVRRARGLRVGPDEAMIVVEVASRLAGRPVTVLSATPLGLSDATDNRVLRILAVVFSVLLLFAGALIWTSTRRALRPVEAIRMEVAAITATTELTRRVPVPASNDEVARLAATMNATLERLDMAVARQHRFVADAGHELRSPLASLRSQLEVAGGIVGDPAWTETADGMRIDLARLERLVADLLVLARRDDAQPTRFEPVDLGHLVRAEQRRRPTVPGITVHVHADNALVNGDETELARILRNLLDNAERHATSRVEVDVSSAPDAVILSVRNDGPPIPDGELVRIFDRFHRLDEARSSDAGGSGLGLAIVAELVAAHGGTVHAQPRDDGASIIVSLPRLPELLTDPHVAAHVQHAFSTSR